MGSELNAVEAMVEVVWVDIHLEKDGGEYRAGVRFAEISTQDMASLRDLLRSLSSP